MEAYDANVDRIYVVTLSSHLSGSYNSAILGKNLLEEVSGAKQIHVVDSESASCGETQIAMKLMELEEEGHPFETIVERIEAFRDALNTYFILDNLETLRKNGRLSRVKALVASTLSIKPVMGAEKGTIVQRGQSIGMKKALSKMAELAVEELKDAAHKRLIISHCNAPKRAEAIKELILSKVKVKETIILNTAGLSSMYANDGGVIVAI
jgi:DegV family protein with EDD domain